MSFLSLEFRARLLALSPEGRRRLVQTLEGRPCPKSCRCRMHLIPVGCTSLKEAVRSLGKPCRHVARRQHNVSVCVWGEILAIVGDAIVEDGEVNDYAEPPRPLVPVCLVTQRGRIATMTRRQADHEGLRDPEDSYEQDRVGEAGADDSPSGENAYGSGMPVLDGEATRPTPPVNNCDCLFCWLDRAYPGRFPPCLH